MMTEKYPTWLTGHVKEWAQKRLPTVTLCSTTGNELLEVWYYGDLLTLNEEPQLYIVPSYFAPELVTARDPESGEEFVIFDGGRHGYDNLFCDEHDPSELEHRPLKRYEIPASKLVLELGYSIDYEDEKENFEPDEADTVEADHRRAYALGAGQAGRHRLYRPLLCERERKTSPDPGRRAGLSIPQPDDGIKEGDSVIGTDENRAVLHVEVIFWSGKRKIPPSLVSGKYCPHFVVTGTTEYLGVCFLDGTECTFDTPALGNAQPLYPDTIDYAPLENNAEFLIYEGANAVGKGRVLGRTVPYKVKQQRK